MRQQRRHAKLCIGWQNAVLHVQFRTETAFPVDAFGQFLRNLVT